MSEKRQQSAIERVAEKNPAAIARWREREIFGGDSKRTPAQRFRMLQHGLRVHRILAEAFLENGAIDPRGKTVEQLQQEVQDRIGDLLTSGYEPKFLVLDYRDDLVREARRFVRSKQYPFALIFYATYFEHWINLRIATALEKRKFSDDDIKHVLQKTGDVRAKNLILRALGLPSIPLGTLGDVLQIGDRRNMYVHYKWTPKPMNSKDGAQYETLLRNAERAVTRLRRLDNRPFKGRKRVLVAPISRKAFLEADQLLQEVYATFRESGMLMSAEDMEARMKEILAERSKREKSKKEGRNA